MSLDVPALPAGTPVLVTGATGFTGSVLVRRLAGRGLQVRAIARRSSSLEALADLPIEWVRGDVFDPDVVERAAAGVRCIFHLAAAYRQAAVPDEYYRLVHGTSTELLVDAARRTPDFIRFVHVSTIGVHGHIDRPPADETAPFAPGDAYQRTKAEAEQWLAEHATRHGLPFAIIRPCAIYGPGDTRLLKVFRMAARGVFPMLGSGRTLYHLIHVEDLAAIIERAATHPAARGEAFIAGNPEPIPMTRMVAIIGEALGRRVRVVRLPAAPVFALAALCEAACRPLGIEPPLYRRRVAFYTKDRAFDTRKLRERLGYRCRYTNEEGLAMTARWYRDQGWLGGRRRR
jgi:nucleoside-diphosphate-sugar epimerase